MKLTEDHRRKVLADVFSMLYGKPVHGDTLGIASYMARNCLQELLHKGEIDFVPDVKCEFTTLGSTIDRNMQWSDVTDRTSITITFIDPDTGDMI